LCIIIKIKAIVKESVQLKNFLGISSLNEEDLGFFNLFIYIYF